MSEVIQYHNHMIDIQARDTATVLGSDINTVNKIYPSVMTRVVVPQVTADVIRLSDEKKVFKTVSTIKISRLNSNIYKNIFPESVFDYTDLTELAENSKSTLEDVVQKDHGFIVGNILCEIDGTYYRAIAEDSQFGVPVGIVSQVVSNDVFTLLSTGVFEWKDYFHDDTSVLYLSDAIPGTMVHYSVIKTKTYVPVAVYIGSGKILLNLQQGSVGAELAPYQEYTHNFESYTKTELDAVVEYAISGAIT